MNHPGGDGARPKAPEAEVNRAEAKNSFPNRTGRRRSEISEEMRAEVRRLAEPVKNRFTLLDFLS